MPSDIPSLLIILLAIVPGYLGEKIFTHFTGKNWRTKDWENIVRVLVFSFLGLLAYIFISRLLNLPKPTYIFPSTFNADNIDNLNLLTLALPYSLHWVLSALIALFLGLIIKQIGRKTPTISFPTAWDIFSRNYIDGNWVVVTLISGENFMGYLSFCDLSVSPEERDVILEEPAKYIDSEFKYLVLDYKALFLPSSQIIHISVIDNDDDFLKNRLTIPGCYINGGKTNAEKY